MPVQSTVEAQLSLLTRSIAKRAPEAQGITRSTVAVISPPSLDKLGVNHVFRLEPLMKMGGIHRFYITRPDMLCVTQIAEHIKHDMRANVRREYRIIFVPRRLATVDYIIEREGVHQYVQVLEWDQLHLIPLDEHLLSLERHNSISTLYLDGNHTMLHSIATSIILLEDIFGSIPVVHGKGNLAEKVWTLLGRLKESRPLTPPQQPPAISELILFDRQCDLVTPLCSQLTYEGILDDVFSIRSGFVEVGKEITGKQQNVKLLLNAQDPVFAEIRSLHFVAVPGVLSDISRQLRAHYDEGRRAYNSVTEMKSFVKRLPELRKRHDSLATHLNVSEKIVVKKKLEDFQKQLDYERAILEAGDKVQITDHIEECLHRQINFRIPLKLMCLMSTTNNGIKPKYLDSLKTQFMHSYGHRHLPTFYNLERFGLIEEKVEESQIPGQAHKSTFKQLSRHLKLVPKHPESYDIQTPKDMAYVYGGAYQPLSCAAIDHIARVGGWRGLDDVVKSWNGPIFTSGQGATTRVGGSSQPASLRPPQQKVVLVYFIGGCTFSEINALHFLKEKTNRHYIVATTHLINGDSVIDSMVAEQL